MTTALKSEQLHSLTINDLEALTLDNAKFNDDRNYPCNKLSWLARTDKMDPAAVLAGEPVCRIGTPDGAAPMTTHAAFQLAQRGGMTKGHFEGALKAYLTHGDPEFFTAVGRHWARYKEHKGDDPMLIRCRVNGRRTVRAVLTNRYGIVDAVDLIQGLKQILPEAMHEARFSGMKNDLKLDSDGLKCKLLIPSREIDQLSSVDPHHLGLIMGTNEVGNGGINGLLSVGRKFCTNQLVAGGKDCFSFDERHIGDGIGRIIESMLFNLRQAIDAAPQEFQRYWNTRDMRVENPADCLLSLEPMVDLGKRAAKKIIDEKLPAYVAEMGPTAFAIVNACTEWARDLEDREKAEMVEVAAGKLVRLPQKVWRPHLVSAN